MSDQPSVNRRQLRGLYARLRGISRALDPSPSYAVDGTHGIDFIAVVEELRQVTGEELSFLRLDRGAIQDGRERATVVRAALVNKLEQAIQYLEGVYGVAQEVVEIGTLYNAIKDDELKRRCGDLLSAPGDFDRVINQATQVLEDRIRTKSGADRSLTGTDLVNQTVKSEPTKTTLKVADDKGEQEGFANILRGVMQAFRNPTHHQITDKFSREDALKVCAFIDNLVRLVDQAHVMKRGA